MQQTHEGASEGRNLHVGSAIGAGFAEWIGVPDCWHRGNFGVGASIMRVAEPYRCNATGFEVWKGVSKA